MARPKAKSRGDLLREVTELKAQLASTYHFASAELHRTSKVALMGSGVLVQLTGLGGRDLTCPFVVLDGLSDDTIAALRRDIARSYETAIALKPKT